MVAFRLPCLSSRAALLGAALLAWPAPGATPAPGVTPTLGATPAPGATPASAGYASNPPLGHTGGFGEPTCQACHTDAPLNHPDAMLAAEGLPDRYASGALYRITLSVTGVGQVRGGFQASIRFAEGPLRGLQAGHLSATDQRVLMGTDTLTSVQYALHSEEGAELVAQERGEWVVEWTAPESGSPVVLHVAANSANGDNSPFGDLIHTLERVSRGLPPPPPSRRASHSQSDR